MPRVLTARYTGKKPYNKLKGYLEVDSQVLNKKQLKVFNRAKRKVGTSNRKLFSNLRNEPNKGYAFVQLHRNEMVLTPEERNKYVKLMQTVNYPYKK